MAALEPTQSFHPNGFYVPVLLPFVALMHRKRLTIVLWTDISQHCALPISFVQNSRLVVQTAGSIELARFISTFEYYLLDYL
jgi:hypothetical protein